MDPTASAADSAALAEAWNTIITPYSDIADCISVLRPTAAIVGAVRRGLPIALTPLSIEEDEDRWGWLAGSTFLVPSHAPRAVLEGAASFVRAHQGKAQVVDVTITTSRRRVSFELKPEDAIATLQRLLAKVSANDPARDAGAAPDSDAPGSGEQQTISLASALDAIAEFLRRYVVFAADAQVVAVTLWIAHTHAIDAFDVSPYLAVTSAEKGSGKTRLLELLDLVVAHAWRIVSPTEAVLFRKIDAASGYITVLFDEGDAVFSQVAEGLRATLNAGNRRGAVVTRCVGQNAQFRLVDFRVFCPKAIAAIGNLPGTIEDRSIPIRLRRRIRTETVERFRLHEAQAASAPLRQALEAWATTAVAAIRAAQPIVPEALNDRAAEGWETLFAIADLAGGDWPGQARAAALALHAHGRDEDSLGVQLLRAIAAVFRERNLPSNRGLFTADLLNALDAREGEPWHDVLRIDPVRDSTARGSAARLAKQLRAYGVQPRTLRGVDAAGQPKVAKG